LKDRGSEGASTGRRFAARNLMVIGQVALSLAMLTAAGIFARTAMTAAAGNPGHSYEGLLLASLDGDLAGFDEARGRAQSTKSFEIVGVAPPIREELLDRVPGPHVYVPFGGNYQAGMFLLVRSAGQVSDVSAVDALRKEIRLADARLPMLSLSTMQAFHDKGLELWALQTGAQLFTILGFLALLLALVGVYAVKSYVVSQRTREIGIRMALGASGPDVLRLILRHGLFLTGAGVAIGLPLAILVSVAFTKVFVETGGFDPVVVSTAMIVLALTATLAGAVPARRATKIQPLRGLQGE
jgi:hypothetical protein